MNTPICDFVRAYAARECARLHMPGHKGIGPLGVEALDITEVPGADVLYAACGVIAESEANAAAIFGSAATRYSVEGSSLCIRAMLCLAQLWARECGRPPLILAARNAHKTFLSAAALLDLPVEWLFSETEGQGVVACSVTARALERRLAAMEEKPIGVYITSPNYLGERMDIAALAEVCHRNGTLLLVDNAHGAYLKFLRGAQHPLDLGADLCCDSAHKTLPVLTGGAYLHISRGAPPLLCAAADRALSLFAGTSPSYLLLQSLDAANRALATDYVNKIMSTADKASALRVSLETAGWATVGDEPLKLTLCPKARGYTGTELAERLARGGITAEFADPDYVVFMFAAATPEKDYALLLRALEDCPPRAPLTERPPALRRPRAVLTPREAMLARTETVPAARAAGRVLAAPGVSCPPAVPILVCGEEIDESAVRAFRYYGIEHCEVVK